MKPCPTKSNWIPPFGSFPIWLAGNGSRSLASCLMSSVILFSHPSVEICLLPTWHPIRLSTASRGQLDVAQRGRRLARIANPTTNTFRSSSQGRQPNSAVGKIARLRGRCKPFRVRPVCWQLGAQLIQNGLGFSDQPRCLNQSRVVHISPSPGCRVRSAGTRTHRCRSPGRPIPRCNARKTWSGRWAGVRSTRTDCSCGFVPELAFVEAGRDDAKMLSQLGFRHH